LKESSQTFPRAGLMLNGNVYRQKVLEPLTKGKECILLPTPTKMDGYGYSLKQTLRKDEVWETITSLTGFLVAKILSLTGKQAHKKQ